MRLPASGRPLCDSAFRLRAIILAVLIIAASLLSEKAFAQGETTSAIVGQVTDGSGAVVPGASITITNQENGLKRSAKTDDGGRFNFPKVPTRRWLAATRVSTAPGKAVSRSTRSPVVTAAKARVVGTPRAAIASLTMYSRKTGPSAALPSPPRENHRGRYAYSNQPPAAHWNLTRLAEALLPVLEQETGGQEAALASANKALAAFEPQFEAARSAGLRRKIGLFTEREGDAKLAEDLLERMSANRADFTLSFRRLCGAAAGPEGDAGVRALFADPDDYDSWACAWRRRLSEEPGSGQARAAAMRTVNPAFIPRNHVVEAALDAAVSRQDFLPFEELLDVVSRPYEDRPNLERYATPARPDECVRQTFCGT